MIDVIMPASRLVKGAEGSLTHQFTDSDGEPSAPPAGTIAVTVARSDGTAVSTGSVTGSSDEPRAVTVAVTELLVTDWLTATWTLDGSEIAVDTFEVCGGTLGSIAALKTTDPNLNTTPNETLLTKRRTVEDMSLVVLRRAVFERFCVERVDGTGTARLPVAFGDVREVAWVKVWSSTTSTSFTAAELAAIPATEGATLTRTDGGVWPCGVRNIEVGYRFGMRACPGDLLDALRKSVRYALTSFDSGVPSRATAMTTGDGFSIGLAGPGNDDWATGDVEVDRVVNRYKRRSFGIA